MPSREMITFPPGVLGDAPARFPLLARTPEFFALNKPAGVAVAEDPFWADTPNLLDAIRDALKQGKPQLADLGIDYVGAVHTLDVEVTGVVIFAANAAAEARLRNAAGSQQFEFVFELIAEAGSQTEPVTCDLPLARNKHERRMAVSHSAGKKCATAFAPLRRVGRYVVWEARTRENRPHQVRIHASECGLCVPGERRYGRVPLVFLSGIKRHFRPGPQEEKPLHGPLCVHLREVRFPAADRATTSIEAPLPKSWHTLLKRLEREE
jgi:23S rRNA-/tRNA-specific pseudouridylate synthase